MEYICGPYKFKDGLIYKRGFILFKQLYTEYYSYNAAVEKINSLCGIKERDPHVGNTLHESNKFINVKTTKSSLISNKEFMKNQQKFNMTFEEALQCLKYNDCWVQGSDFIKGVVLINHNDVIKIRNFNNYNKLIPLVLKGSIIRQKYRKVYFQSEA